MEMGSHLFLLSSLILAFDEKILIIKAFNLSRCICNMGERKIAVRPKVRFLMSVNIRLSSLAFEEKTGKVKRYKRGKGNKCFGLY